jgi:formylglycine-generating enzyme required for sulfatase activity
MHKEIRKAIARIEVLDSGQVLSRGTGVLVADFWVLTALHVVADRSVDPPRLQRGEIVLHFPGHRTRATFEPDRCDTAADYALLRCQTSPPVHPIPLAERPMAGIEWHTYGFPDANPRDGMVQSGRVRNPGGELGGVPVIQLFSEEAAAGNGAPVKGLSGAPVIVDNAVVGLLRYALMKENLAIAGTLYACPLSLVLTKCGDVLPPLEPGGGSPVITSPAGTTPAPPDRGRRRMTLTIVVSTLLIGAGIAALVSSKLDTPPAPPVKPPIEVTFRDMVRIPRGSFLMGRNGSVDPEASPAHEVTIETFWLDKRPVTNTQFREFLQISNRPVASKGIDRDLSPGNNEWPVTEVTWDDAYAYCLAQGKRLPTEAEWEFAARGADGRLYPWGEAFERANTNSRESGVGHPEPVGARAGNRSPFDVEDMAGNVWQWCMDDYLPYPGSKPGFAIPAGAKVIRGGSFESDAHHATAITRNLELPATRSRVIGFRCAK